jgi:hypothetical protein
MGKSDGSIKEIYSAKDDAVSKLTTLTKFSISLGKLETRAQTFPNEFPD